MSLQCTKRVPRVNHSKRKRLHPTNQVPTYTLDVRLFWVNDPEEPFSENQKRGPVLRPHRHFSSRRWTTIVPLSKKLLPRYHLDSLSFSSFSGFVRVTVLPSRTRLTDIGRMRTGEVKPLSHLRERGISPNPTQ